MSDTQDLVQEAITRTLLNFKKFDTAVTARCKPTCVKRC